MELRMKKSFVLITRSYKYGGYCIAGFDMETKQWIRLVTSGDPYKNEIPKSVFEPFDDLDILEVETVRAESYGCQTENFVLDRAVPPVRKGRLSFYELLDSGYVKAPPTIFGNVLSYLSEEETARQRTSLGLFKVQSLVFDYFVGDDGKPHYRSKFLYEGKQYSGLSVTDPIYRKDGFAGGTIEHALLVVSLPAVPYPNGKYYKFIAKIFPLSAEEAARIKTAPSVISAPRPRIFARDFPDASRDSISLAVHFLQSLAEGRDPDTNAVLDPVLILSPSYEAWLRYCVKTMMKASAGEKIGRTDKKTTYLLRGNIGKIQLSDDPIPASKLSQRVNAVCEPYGKKLTAVAIGAFFLQAGMLREESAGRKRKFPTELGRTYGIGTEQRITGNGIRYFIILYGRAAQQFFVDNIDRCVEVLDGSARR